MVEYILYDGVGANKSGKHTVAEFLKIMNKTFNIECSEYTSGLNYKPCTEMKEMNREMMENNNLLRSKKAKNKYTRLLNKCMKHKKTAKNRKCTLDEYIEFSGAMLDKPSV